MALRDILASACSMKPIGGENPGLMTDTHFFCLYPDRIVQIELGGGPVLPIEYGDGEYGTLSAVLNASGSTTATFAELLNDGRLQQVVAMLSELQERRRTREAEEEARLERERWGGRQLRGIRFRP
ncbi:MAG: hypothetical protein ABSF26_24865 [Thermoguttaceae bacterium]